MQVAEAAMTRESAEADAASLGIASGAYRPDIDGLRSIAVLLVVLFHLGLPEALQSGFIGVDMFFVISGYLIIPRVHLQVLQHEFRFGEFYSRRIRRLAPALLSTMVIAITMGLLILTPGELVQLSKESIASQLYVSNIYYWRYLNYFGLQADLSFLLHTWSLGVEEQFYLTFPIAIWLTGKFFPKSITLILSIIFLGSFCLNLAMVGSKPEATFYLLPTRAWEFAAGGLAATLAQPLLWRPCWMPWLSAAGVVLLTCALIVHESTMAFPGWFAALPVGATAALLISGTNPSGWWARIMSLPVPVYLGRISYELYLVHWPVKIFAGLLVPDFDIPARVAALLMCIALAAAIYHLVEKPVRAKWILSTNRNLVVAYAAGTAALTIALVGIIGTGGLPGRLSASTLTAAAAAEDADTAHLGCEGFGSKLCRLGKLDVEPTWLVYGDSHAEALAGAFDRVLLKRGQSAAFAFLSGCLPVLDSGDAKCREFNSRTATFLAGNPAIRHVVLVSTWRQPLERGYTDAGGIAVSGQRALVAFQQNLGRTLVADGYATREIIVWLPVPGAKHSVPTTSARNLMLNRNWDLRFSRKEYDDRFTFLFEILKQYPRVHLINPAARICDLGSCRVSWNGRALYHDEAHPAQSQAGYFADIIECDLRAAASTTQ